MAGTNVFNDYVAGAIGGCVGMAVGHPMDTIKVQMQTQPAHNQYKGVWDCAKSVSHSGFSKGFFRGMSWPLMSYSFMNSIFFGAYGHLLQQFGHNKRECTEPLYLSVLAAACIATVPTVFIACPIDVIKVTMQSQIQHESPQVLKRCPVTQKTIPLKFYKGPVEAVIDIYKMSGMRGIFRGLGTQMARDSPANIIYMVSFEFTTFHFTHLLPSVPAQAVNFMCGGLAGVISWLPIMPFDVIKSRIQADTCEQNYKGFWDCAIKSYKAEGIFVFWRGSKAVIIRAFPVNGVTLMVYSDVLKWMNRWNI